MNRNADIKTFTNAQESTNAIERLYVSMRHLLNRGFYKPMGVSGETLREALLTLSPEIYGSINENKVELKGLLYVLDRLPEGIENCRFINLISEEGHDKAHFEILIPKKRRRNCYRVDEEQMNIEITRGRSEIYDILTHITFMYMESEKIRKRVQNSSKTILSREWQKLSAINTSKELSYHQKDIVISHLAHILGRSFDEVSEAYHKFGSEKYPNRLLSVILGLGQLSLDEYNDQKKREISFSPLLRDRIGHHIHSSYWANDVKKTLYKHKLHKRPIHIISSNMHSVMNSLFAEQSLEEEFGGLSEMELFEMLSNKDYKYLRKIVTATAEEQGMIFLKDESHSHINVQLFDTSKIEHLTSYKNNKAPVLIVMDYAFGEQAYGAMDELLKPYEEDGETIFYMNIESVSIMGKAGILVGKKGDIMLPNSHILEGSGGNYPFKNELTIKDFKDADIDAFEGSMVTVLGTSLQNKDLLSFFLQSTWKAIGLEMEGTHYQKAIQAASKIRGSINKDVKVRYAYYASDNPLETGSTLASGGLGTTGVKPTYTITRKILTQIFGFEI